MDIKCLLLGRKAMTNLDSVLKSRNITLPTKVHIVKGMVFPVVMYGCEKVRVAQERPTLCDPTDFSRPEYWSGLPFPSPGDLPNPGIKPGSPTLWADALPSEPPGKTLKPKEKTNILCYHLHEESKR